MACKVDAKFVKVALLAGSASELFCCTSLPPSPLLKLVERYTDLHRDLVGTYEGELFRRPQPEVLHRMRGSFRDFLAREGLAELEPLFVLGMKAFGYE